MTISPDDVTSTQQLIRAGHLLDIPVEDHLVIGQTWVSLRQLGLCEWDSAGRFELLHERTIPMQFTIPRDKFLPVLGALSRTARPNGPLPQLGFAQLTAKDGMLHLFATNLKWSVTHEVPCAGITQPGQGAIPAKLVTDFVGQLPPESLSCTWHPNTLRLDLACRGFQAQLPGWNPEDLPAPPGAGATPLTTLPAPTLRTLIESVTYAAADDATKVLSNVLFHFHEGHLTLVGADGFRLVRRSTALESLALPPGAQTPDLQLL